MVMMDYIEKVVDQITKGVPDGLWDNKRRTRKTGEAAGFDVPRWLG